MATASIYRPLDQSRQQIRLIEIAPFDPRDKSAVIDCRLHVMSLLDQPEFVALSYVWGDPNVTTEILVDGAPFQATVNLAAALRQAVIHAPVQIQLEDEAAWTDVESDDDDDDGDDDTFKYEYEGASAPSDGADRPKQLRFWADAICINQEDKDEKNDQIPLMRPIYSGARLVIGSLGNGDSEELDLGLQTLEDICRAYMRETLRNDCHGLPDDDSSKGGEFEWLRSLPHLLDAPAAGAEARWNALETLGYLPYFRRVWIAQEMVLARSVVLVTEHRSFDLAAYAKAFRAFSIEEGTDNIFRGTRPRFVSAVSWLSFRLLDKPIVRLSIILLLKETFATFQLGWQAQSIGLDLQAMDKRDYVYGMLGISGLDIRVDYNKSVADVYADMVETCVRDGAIDHLDEFLVYAGVGLAGYLADAPSWTPSPTSGNHQQYIKHAGKSDATTGVFEAAPGSAACRVKYTPGDLELYLRGIRLEEIVRKYDIPPLQGRADDQERLEFMEYIMSVELVTGIQGESRAGVIIETLFPRLQEALPGSEPAPEQENVGGGHGSASPTCSFAAACLLENVLEPRARGSQEFKSDRHKELYYRLYDELRGVRGCLDEVALTKLLLCHNLIFQCLFETGRGDVVCVLEGSRVPALLRRRDGDRYVHVGLCHIPGLMDGKVASELVARGDTVVEEFVLV